MLLTFKVKNYRSFREEAILDLEAAGLKEYNNCLLNYKKNSYVPAIAIYGKNGGGKSNLVRAFWLAVQFIRNAQRTQHETAEIPVRAFELDDVSRDLPTEFEFVYEYNDIKYEYGFAATKKNIVKEYLFYAPKGKKAMIFSREFQNFSFPEDKEKSKKEMLKEAVGSNQLFFAMACVMNYQPCIDAMGWFRNEIFFSRDFNDIGHNLIEYGEDPLMLQAIVSTAQIADVGINDMKFEINNKEIRDFNKMDEELSDDVKQSISKALFQLKEALESGPNAAEGKLMISEIKTTSYHTGIDSKGKLGNYTLSLRDESDGTRKLMAIAPAIEKAIEVGGLVVIDEIERELHPILVEYIINRFQNSDKNKNSAQLIFTTHSTEIMSREMLRRDQIYFVDKDRAGGNSELYSLSDFSPRKDENIYKAYILGKYGAIPHIEEE
jgi:hypothetical protein